MARKREPIIEEAFREYLDDSFEQKGSNIKYVSALRLFISMHF
jgi:hypothetical protein